MNHIPKFPAQGLQSERLSILLASRRHARALQEYGVANRDHFQPWEPLRQGAFYTLTSTTNRLEMMEQRTTAQSALYLLLFMKEGGQLVGDCNFTNIVRGSFQACHLGFSLDRQFEGQGLMRECLSTAIPHMFETQGLHRIMAAYRPENARSAKLLDALGFEREGIARSYLKINGAWADHVLTSLVNPKEV